MIGFVVAARYALDFTVARVGGTVSFGEYAVVMAYAMTLAMLAAGGLPDLANQRLPELRRLGRVGAARSFIRLGATTSLALGIVLGSAASVVGIYVGDGAWTLSKFTLAALVPVVALFTFRRQQVLLTGRSRLGLFAPSLVSAIAATAVLLAALVFDLVGAAVALTAVTLAYALMSLFQARRGHVGTDGDSRPATMGEIRGWLRAGGVVVLNNVATILTAHLDVLLVAYFATAVETGVYAAASRLALLVTLALAGLIPREGES